MISLCSDGLYFFCFLINVSLKLWSLTKLNGVMWSIEPTPSGIKLCYCWGSTHRSPIYNPFFLKTMVSQSNPNPQPMKSSVKIGFLTQYQNGFNPTQPFFMGWDRLSWFASPPPPGI